MSQSPEGEQGDIASYVDGWAALFKMLREGASFSGRERNRAFLNVGGGRFREAAPQLERSLALDPKLITTPFISGVLHLVTEDYEAIPEAQRKPVERPEKVMAEAGV